MLQKAEQKEGISKYLLIPLRSEEWVSITILPHSDSLKLGMQKVIQQKMMCGTCCHSML